MDEEINPYVAPQSAVLSSSANDADLPLASRWHRLGAILVDSLIMAAIVIPLQWITGTFQRNMAAAQRGMDTSLTLENFAWGLVGLGILVAVNWGPLQHGQTIGKRLLKIRVSNLDGSPCDRMQNIVWRMFPGQIAALIPYVRYVYGIVDCVMIFRSDKRTLHDFIAKTKVVDLRPQLG